MALFTRRLAGLLFAPQSFLPVHHTLQKEATDMSDGLVSGATAIQKLNWLTRYETKWRFESVNAGQLQFVHHDPSDVHSWIALSSANGSMTFEELKRGWTILQLLDRFTPDDITMHLRDYGSAAWYGTLRGLIDQAQQDYAAIDRIQERVLPTIDAVNDGTETPCPNCGETASIQIAEDHRRARTQCATCHAIVLYDIEYRAVQGRLSVEEPRRAFDEWAARP